MSIKFYVSLIIRANYFNIQAPIPRRGNVIMLRDLYEIFFYSFFSPFFYGGDVVSATEVE